MTFDKEHSIETYKSLISISQFGLRFVLLINGGAAVAVLAFVGDLASSVGMLPNVGAALGWYVAGIALGVSAVFTAYLTQLVLYNEPRPGSSPRFFEKHQLWLKTTIVLIVLSIFAFALGSFEAISSYEKLFQQPGG